MKSLLVAILAGLLLAPAALPVVAGPIEAGPVPLAPRQGNSDIPSACGAVVTETVSRTAVRLCETTDVTVTAAVTCPERLPLHVVFAVAKHLLMEDDLQTVKREASAAASSLDYEHGAMAGLVTLSAQEQSVVELTEDKGRVVSAIRSINLDRVDPTINESDWLGAAQRMLDDARAEYPDRSPIDIIILYTTGCPTGFEGYCQRMVNSASKAKNSGTTIVSVCNPNARPLGIPLPGNHCNWIRQMSTNPFYHDLRGAGRVADDLVALQASGEALGLARVTLLEQLGPSVRFVTGLADPQPTVSGDELTWSWRDVLPGSLLTATWRITPTSTGVLDLRTTKSRLSLADSLDRLSSPIPIPPRPLSVSACLPDAPTPTTTSPSTDTPTPTVSPAPTDSPAPTASPAPPATAPPTLTPAAADTPLPSATPTPEPAIVYLPAALRGVCKQAVMHTDVVLVIDASTSMLEQSDGRTKLDRAKDAARTFVDLLDLRADQASIISFQAEVTLGAPLCSDRARLVAAIDEIAARPGTHIHLAIDRARDELQTARSRPGSRPVIVLMTDGRPADGTSGASRAAAATAKDAGITLYAIGLGDDIDAALLAEIATSAGHYVPAPAAVDLQRIYAAIAGALPCPGDAMWPSAGR